MTSYLTALKASMRPGPFRSRRSIHDVVRARRREQPREPTVGEVEKRRTEANQALEEAPSGPARGRVDNDQLQRGVGRLGDAPHHLGFPRGETQRVHQQTDAELSRGNGHLRVPRDEGYRERSLGEPAGALQALPCASRLPSGRHERSTVAPPGRPTHPQPGLQRPREAKEPTIWISPSCIGR